MSDFIQSAFKWLAGLAPSWKLYVLGSGVLVVLEGIYGEFETALLAVAIALIIAAFFKAMSDYDI